MKILSLEETDSTNIYAKKHLTELEDCTVISSRRQTAGRGRLNRSWLDLGDGNLFVSIVLKPSEVFNKNFVNLTQFLSVCIAKTIESYGLKTEIKWPNDVNINGKKIAGILSETVMQGAKLKGIILGFGINVTADSDDVKKVADKEVTSLSIELGSNAPEKSDFLTNLLNCFFGDYNKFMEEGFCFIKHDYLSRVNFIGKEISVKLPNEIKCGFAESIDDDGALHLKENKEVFVLTIGDII